MQHKGAKQIFVLNKGHFTWCQTFFYGCGSIVDIVCAEAENGWKRVASPRTIVSAPKIVSHVYTLRPRTRSHISPDFIVFIISEFCEHMPCHAIGRVMSVPNDIFPMLIARFSQFIAKIKYFANLTLKSMFDFSSVFQVPVFYLTFHGSRFNVWSFTIC